MILKLHAKKNPYLLCLIMLFPAVFMPRSELVAQNHSPGRKKYSICVSKKSIQEVIDHLGNLSGTGFSYPSNLLTGEKRITINIVEKTIDEILIQILKNTGLDFKILENTIIIFPVKKTHTLENKPQQPKKKFGSGHLRDERRIKYVYDTVITTISDTVLNELYDTTYIIQYDTLFFIDTVPFHRLFFNEPVSFSAGIYVGTGFIISSTANTGALAEDYSILNESFACEVGANLCIEYKNVYVSTGLSLLNYNTRLGKSVFHTLKDENKIAVKIVTGGDAFSENDSQAEFRIPAERYDSIIADMNLSDKTGRYTYFEIPLLFGICIYESDKMNIRLGGGIHIGLLAGKPYQSDYSPEKEDIRRSLFAWNASTGIHYKLESRIHVFANICHKKHTSSLYAGSNIITDKPAFWEIQTGLRYYFKVNGNKKSTIPIRPGLVTDNPIWSLIDRN